MTIVKTSTGQAPITANNLDEAGLEIVEKIKGMDRESAIKFLNNLGVNDLELFLAVAGIE